MIRLTWMFTILAVCVGCPPTGGSDAGTPDAGENDAGTEDAGASDAGVIHPYCSEGPGISDNGTATPSEVVEFREKSGFSSTQVTVRRRINGIGGGNTTDYSLERMSVKTADVDACVVEPTSLTYDWAHHNHDDYLIAVDGEHTYQLHIGFETVPPYGWLVTFEIRATDGGALTYGPIEMDQPL
jgi:hypothetical protein